MKKLILSILAVIVGTFIFSQNLFTTDTEKQDSMVSVKIESLLNDITTDLNKAVEEKDALDKTLEKNKLLIAEKDRRIERILKKIKERRIEESAKTIKVTEAKTIVKVVEKERYSLIKDSICVRNKLFSKKCVEYEPYYLLIDRKKQDTLVLKQR